ncbi:beta-N-acetylhexosaminidase [Aliamphritea hakodatensis]|uniref:beta-N-acetylhexosaminidase n=1 Tax=Aliamphritea hakodatensis TaxID=2895352 RepID=UPI0022FD5AD1|nr:beta-N-acetylhexosaminidase [Aliamphritea hakodatensis]
MSGCLMLDVEGLSLTDEDRQLLKDPQVGGLILFARNFESCEQLDALVQDIRRCNPEILVAVDQEGGRVQRFRDGFIRIPPMGKLGKVYATEPERACEMAEQLGWLMASELLVYGVDISFAPVLDLDFGRSEVIGDRAFAASKEDVTALSTAFIAGMHAAGMAATGKHFPGHGWVVADSHHEIPRDERGMAEIDSQDMAVFRSLAATGLDAVMPAHVIYSQVDQQPAGFSEHWLQQVLRTDLNFDGVIFSDDLTMEGASVAGDYRQRAERALQAGCDMLLVCNDRAAALQVLDYLNDIEHQGSERIARMLARQKPAQEALRADPRWQAALQTARLLMES